MAEVELECAVYGEATVFPVKIARDAKVSALQEAIFDRKRYKERFPFDASELTLYLAKKDGAWLKSDATLKPLLKQGRQEDSEYVVEMIPNWKLNKTEYFGDFQFGEEEIHVLVELPEAAKLVKEIHDQVMDVRGNLDRVQVQFATGELKYLLNKDPARYSLLQSLALTSGEALQIRTSVRSAIKSVTRNAIGIREGVLLDGPLNLSQGQAKSAFYYAYSRFGGILVAKVYGAMYKKAFQREVDVNFALGSHANIVQFVRSFSIGNTENEQRHIIVMPFFARCAADLLTQQSPIELRALITIAHNCFEALCHIHSKKYCFADLKPANIMLHSGEQGGATLVDFGGAVRLGDPIVEVTDQFCLDVAKLQGSELLDWTCLGTTMAQLANIDITKYHSRQDLVRFLKDGHEQVDHLVGQLIISCLENPSETRIKSALNRLPISF
ncbi:putative protein kinase [Plasmopara halstedii]